MINQVKLISYYLLYVTGVALVLWLLSGCCNRKTYESIIRDTVTVERVDSVVVTMREVDVDVPVPQITLEQWVPIDTLSVLDNGLYVSTVEVVGGQIHHTLKPVEGATLPATVTVSDTTHITQSVTHTSHTEKEKQVVEKQPPWWQRARTYIDRWLAYAFVLLIIAVAIIYVVRRNLRLKN